MKRQVRAKPKAKPKKPSQRGKNIFKSLGRTIKNQVLPAIRNQVVPAISRVAKGVGKAALKGSLEAAKATPFVSGAIRAGEELLKGVAQQGGRRKPRQYGMGRNRASRMYNVASQVPYSM